jgi:hypothetical protein
LVNEFALFTPLVFGSLRILALAVENFKRILKSGKNCLTFTNGYGIFALTKDGSTYFTG